MSKRKKKNKIKKTLLNHLKLSSNICNIIFSYINYSYTNLVSIHNKNKPKSINFIINNKNILDIITECCINGYSGFSANFLPADVIINFQNQVDNKYNNILQYYYYGPVLIFRLKYTE